MQASTNRGRRPSRARGVSLLAVVLAVAVGAPLVEWTATAWAQYGGVTPNAPYDQSRRVARRTARRTARRQDEIQQPYEQQPPPQQPYPQQPYPQQPYPQQPYPPPQH
jgi:hypothetical protein